FDPLRTRLQAFVDRIFSRTRYDGARVLATVGGELAATLARDRIVALVQTCVDEAIPNAGTRLVIVRAGDGGIAGVPGSLAARLEAGVREGAAQRGGANRDLAEAYAELKNAEVQLVRSEKMASLGRLVAGGAHEINNPVSFIATSVGPLRRRLENASTDAPPE